jgi:glycosyltransferase involved in cell wall biosynthesis
MTSQSKLLSIVTPTYNRGYLLENCYQSLKIQTNKNFEWIIVDDGSTDNTKQIVSNFIAEKSGINIVYVQKKNGGKHTALNISHKYINGDYVLMLDSDDTLIETAVEEALDGWSKFSDNEDVGVVTFLKGSTTEKPNAYVKEEGVPLNNFKCNRICVFSSDCCEIIRTDLFKKYPFPEFANEHFMSEGVLWNRVAQTHKYVYINKVIYICEYLEGGLTKSGRTMRIKNPYGGMLNSDLNMNKQNSLKKRIKNGLLYDCYGYFANLTPFKILMNSDSNNFLKFICLLPGYILYLEWKIKYFNA